MEERKLRGDLTAAFCYQKEGYRDKVWLFSEVWSGRTKDNGHKLLQGKFQLSLKKKIFQNMVQPWGRIQKGGGIVCPWRL